MANDQVMKQLRRIKSKLKGQAPAPAVVMTPLDTINVSRLFYFKSLVDQTRDVPGDIVECGVGNARSLLSMALVVKLQGDKRCLWGFDSFEGFPEPTSEDASPRNPQKGEYSVAFERVMKTLEMHLGDEHFIRSRITLVKGFFEQTLDRYPGKSISLLNLDVDLYSSYKFCLERLFGKLAVGGIVTFDEYLREAVSYPGAEKAIREFFADKPVEFQRDPFYGKYYVVKRGK